MADSEALRSRRKRRHAANDHSICRHGQVEPLPLPAAQDAPGSLPAAGPCTDPAGALARLAGRLEAAHVADPANAAVARELRATLLVLPPGDAPGEADDDPLAELRDLAGSVP